MPNKAQKSSVIILTISLGIILLGIGNFLWWYFATYKFYSGNSGLGITFSRRSGAQLVGVLAAIFGIINGGISGLIIGAGNFNKIYGALAGAAVNGSVFVFFFILLDAKAVNDLGIGLIGNCVVGGIVGLILAQFNLLMIKNAEKSLE